MGETVNQEEQTPSHVPACVAIGASAGGLEALEEFFKHMPATSGMAFVVIQHLSPEYKSMMVELLSRHTKMKVCRVEDGMPLSPNCVHLIPPGFSMSIFHGKLLLAPQISHTQGLNLPIDIFFHSLAEDQGERSIGIILSGTGSDGTLGVRAIKGAGGMVMAQDEESAKFDGMPRSAIATGLVDFICPPSKMPDELMRYINHPFINQPETVEEKLLSDEDTFGKILSIIRTRTGVDFSFYKPNTIIRRLERRISINRIDSIEEYVSCLHHYPNETSILFRDLLINVTRFFRDGEAWNYIIETVIPSLLAKTPQSMPLRIWSVGCSTGEEPYTLAMLFQEHLMRTNTHREIKIFATDIDADALEVAGTGLYPENIAQDVSPERLKTFFIHTDSGYRINESIRSMVVFAAHNIIKDPPFSRIDLIVCRNLLIYLKPAMQQKIINSFRFSLPAGGTLFLGSSETAGDNNTALVPVNQKWKIYQHRTETSSRRPSTIDFETTHSGTIAQVTRSGLTRREPSLDELITTSLLDSFIPPGVVISESGDIQRVCGDIREFVHLPPGKPTSSLLRMVNPELGIAITTGIHRAIKDNEVVRFRNFKFTTGNDTERIIDLSVRKLGAGIFPQQFLLITFEQIAQSGKDTRAVEASMPHNERILELEQELQYNRENLQATIEELETSNEELQATNEELIASNEELQSTNEELQSVNEELYTVNSEYQQKIEELTQLNNDMDNLLKSTEIGTIFLDQMQHVRKFTPAATRYINLTQADIDRPISHFTSTIQNCQFVELAGEVLRDLVPRQAEGVLANGGIVLIRMTPYRTRQNAIDGVVITFIDISERKRFEQDIAHERDVLLTILENSPVGKTMVDANGRITFVNKRASEILGITHEEFKSRTWDDVRWEILAEDNTPLSPEMLPYSIIRRTRKPAYNLRHNIKTGDGRTITLTINAAPIIKQDGAFDGAVFSLLEVVPETL